MCVKDKLAKVVIALFSLLLISNCAWCTLFLYKVVVNDANGDSINGVTLVASGTAFSSTRTYTVDGAIDFYADYQATDKTWVLTVSKAGYDFNPAILEGQDTSEEAAQLINNSYYRGHRLIFTGTPFIGGSVIDLNGNGVSNITVALSGASSTACTTASNGTYKIGNLSQGNYTITPSGSGYCFNPSSRSYTLGDGRDNQNFIAFIGYYIKGHVRNGQNSAISGVTLTLSGTTSKTAVTDSNGYYELPAIPSGGNYTLTASKAGYAFSSPQSYTQLTANQNNQDFSGGIDIKGYTKDNNGNAVSGVAVTLTGASGQSTTSNSSGYYEFIRLAPGNYSVSPSKTGWSFTPGSSNYVGLSACIEEQNFIGNCALAPTVTVVATPSFTASVKIYNSEINPTQGEKAVVRWSQPRFGTVKIVLYNLLGDKVITLVDNQTYPAGRDHEVTWNGRSKTGSVVGSGIYIVNIQAGDYKSRGKIAVLK